MGRSFRHYSKYAPVLFVFILALLFTQLLVNDGFLGQGVAEAKVIQEKGVFDEETVAFDKANPQIQAVMDVQNRHTDILMAEPGIVGTATGLNEHGRPAILVFAKSFELAKAAVIPSNIEGVPVVVKITGEIIALPKPDKKPGRGGNGGDKVDPTSRFDRPVPIGVSTGHPAITAGTIGCRVKDDEDNVYALSNNHIYADENRASIGDNVLQPGTFDGGKDPADKIGTLAAFKRIVFSTSANNIIDAAIAISSTEDLGNATPSDGYGTPKLATEETPKINQKVMKYGRTTGQTKGSIAGLNVTVNVNYGNGKVARFVDQIAIQPGSFSAGGDSGSLIVLDGKGRDKANKGKPVGLLFAGSVLFTIANPINDVLTSFGVTIDGE